MLEVLSAASPQKYFITIPASRVPPVGCSHGMLNIEMSGLVSLATKVMSDFSMFCVHPDILMRPMSTCLQMGDSAWVNQWFCLTDLPPRQQLETASMT